MGGRAVIVFSRLRYYRMDRPAPPYNAGSSPPAHETPPPSPRRRGLGRARVRAALRGRAARPVPPRFNAAYIDRSADPRADFARYAFGAWQKANPVPEDKARWGSFNELDQSNQLALKGILEEAAARPQKPAVGGARKSAIFSNRRWIPRRSIPPG